MSWTESYQKRIVSAEEALRVVESGQRIYIGGGCAVPESLLQALVARAPDLHDVETISILTMGPAPYCAPETEGHLRHNALFMGHNVRSAVNEGRADYTPSSSATGRCHSTSPSCR
jgi:4-hydroxybutyrate CoA-transferase